MEKKVFEQLEETLYYEQLANGLDVYLLPKAGINKSFATFTTKYGSIDNEFVPLNKTDMLRVPDGIAHFLEHKLFEKEDYDVFEKFSAHSASSNAFTSFTRTCYLFSCTSELHENLTTLIEFVQNPYFSPETVEKEKGIIEQEINMYNDNPDSKAYYAIINNLFHNHPVKIDIAGTVESIQEVTADLLYECYHTFYHPSNMLLFIVGDFDVEATMTLIRDNQAAKDYTKQPPIERQYPNEPATVATPESTMEMEVATPKVLVGIKDIVSDRSGEELLKCELVADMLMDLTLGASSSFHEDMLAKGYINESFTYETSFDLSFGFSLVGGDTKYPEELAQSIKAQLEVIRTIKVDEADFTRIKNKKVGRFLNALNSVEFIANQFTQYAFNGVQLFTIVEILEKITVSDLEAFAKDYFKPEAVSVFTMMPKK
ncbi:MAG TPA: peptidase M16 [Firmicutes bacterium]|nr:peptidase M16 [Bacillota bacterium]